MRSGEETNSRKTENFEDLIAWPVCLSVSRVQVQNDVLLEEREGNKTAFSVEFRKRTGLQRGIDNSESIEAEKKALLHSKKGER